MDPPLDFPFAIVTASVIRRLIDQDLNGCVEAVRQAYLARDLGQTVNPRSVFLRFPDRPEARIIALPAHLAQSWQTSGVKWIASFPENIRKGFPRASAVLILNNHENGYPFACLEGSVISASRTAGSAVLAAECLNRGRRAVHTFGIVGAGLIARYVYRFLIGMEWQIDNVYVYDSVQETAEVFTRTVCDPRRHLTIRVAPNLASLVTQSDLVLFATVAAHPHVHDPGLLAHRPLILHISLRDLAPELLLAAYNVVDDIDHVLQADTSPHLAEQLTGRRDFISATLADLLTSRRPVDYSRPSVFSPFGLGVLDLAVGKWVYDHALAAKQHVSVDHFFDSAG